MYDAALFYSAKAERESRILNALNLQPKQFLLATIHRAENTDDTHRLCTIFEALALTAREMPVILPLHPRTREALKREKVLGRESKNLLLLEPVGYLDMVMLEKHAALIATDSGGVQKEAFFYEVPCVTLRTETEWVELIEMGWNRLVPPVSVESVCAGIMDMLGQRGSSALPYGMGDAAVRILRHLVSHKRSCE
jgi:UDP-GlcNAc3NAcA epimerase